MCTDSVGTPSLVQLKVNKDIKYLKSARRITEQDAMCKDNLWLAAGFIIYFHLLLYGKTGSILITLIVIPVTTSTCLY